MGRVCVSRRWKQWRSRGGGRAAAAPGRAVAGPLFQGSVHLANLVFTGAGGPWSVPPGDLGVVWKYVQTAAGPIAAYASQYGPTRLVAGRLLPPFPAPVGAGGYSDRQLQGWIAQIAQSNGLSPDSTVLVLNPIGVVNQDAKESGGVGVLGYHGFATVPYSFVNLLGTGFTLDDRSDLFAEAVSHELAEMTVDPRADDSNPEVCDGCGTNCRGTSAYRSFFDGQGSYVASAADFPPPFPFAFFLSAIARPSAASDCPAPVAACSYGPPGT